MLISPEMGSTITKDQKCKLHFSEVRWDVLRPPKQIPLPTVQIQMRWAISSGATLFAIRFRGDLIYSEVRRDVLRPPHGTNTNCNEDKFRNTQKILLSSRQLHPSIPTDQYRYLCKQCRSRWDGSYRAVSSGSTVCHSVFQFRQTFMFNNESVRIALHFQSITYP